MNIQEKDEDRAIGGKFQSEDATLQTERSLKKIFFNIIKNTSVMNESGQIESLQGGKIQMLGIR